jgi:hypothetical protein
MWPPFLYPAWVLVFRPHVAALVLNLNSDTRMETKAGTHMGVPYDGDDTVEMVRHDYEFINSTPEIIQQFRPPFIHHPPGVVQFHTPASNTAEQAFPPCAQTVTK